PPVLIEIKSANKINEHHAKALLTLGSSFKSSKRYLISNDPDTKSYSGVLACPWNQAIDQILSENL
ncbi:hypothetical protein KKA47_06995, partial [bacterium]|nr:hypothetical protein [bacterium]